MTTKKEVITTEEAREQMADIRKAHPCAVELISHLVLLSHTAGARELQKTDFMHTSFYGYSKALGDFNLITERQRHRLIALSDEIVWGPDERRNGPDIQEKVKEILTRKD